MTLRRRSPRTNDALVLLLTASGALPACAPARPDVAASGAPTPVARRTAAAPTTSAVVTNAAGAPVFLVEMGDHWFIPARVSVPVGATVEWRMVGTQDGDGIYGEVVVVPRS